MSISAICEKIWSFSGCLKSQKLDFLKKQFIVDCVWDFLLLWSLVFECWFLLREILYDEDCCDCLLRDRLYPGILLFLLLSLWFCLLFTDWFWWALALYPTSFIKLLKHSYFFMIHYYDMNGYYMSTNCIKKW